LIRVTDDYMSDRIAVAVIQSENVIVFYARE